MKGYEQLEFEETRNLGKQNTSRELVQRCFDNEGNEIKIGDYVVGVSGEPKEKNIEGLVINIFSDGMICSIMISTYGGNIIERHGNPIFYKLIDSK